jgi:hypothetical protein
VLRRLDKQPDRILDFELGQDKIVLTQLLDRVTPKAYCGNPIRDEYVRLSRRGASTRISIDINGKRNGGLQDLVIVEEVSPAQLRDRSNFIF